MEERSYSLFGVHIDSEWQCQMKWSRLMEKFNRSPANGFLMWGAETDITALECQRGRDLVVGLEPHLPYTSQFWAIKQFLPEVDTFVPYRLEEIAVNNYSSTWCFQWALFTIDNHL